MLSPTTVDEILAQARIKRQVLQWPLPAWAGEVKVAYRNRLAEGFAQLHPSDIVARMIYLTRSQLQGMVRLASRAIWRQPLRGVGIELGAGCGVLSSVIALNPAVLAVLAVEVCEQTASLLIPRVALWVLGADARKVIPVVGSFDELQLPDDAIDFAIEIDSLHHSDDLVTTLWECARVLKRGGRLLFFDRCHPDAVTDAEVDVMLSRVYDRDFLIAHHYPPDVVLTRRENGEHEYRLHEWKAAFGAAGLTLVRKVDFRPPVAARAAVKGLLSVLPDSVRRAFYQTDGPAPQTSLLWLMQHIQAGTRFWGRRFPMLAPRTVTAFGLVKT